MVDKHEIDENSVQIFGRKRTYTVHVQSQSIFEAVIFAESQSEIIVQNIEAFGSTSITITTTE